MGGLHGGGGSVGLERHEPLNRLSSTSYAGVTNRNEVLHEMFKFRLKFEQGEPEGGLNCNLSKNTKIMFCFKPQIESFFRFIQFIRPQYLLK